MAATNKGRSPARGDVKVGLMGATGMVGTEMLRILDGARLPGRRAAGVRVAAFGGSQARSSATARSLCEVLRDGCFDGLDLVVDRRRR